MRLLATDRRGISQFTHRSRKAPEVGWGVSWEQSEAHRRWRRDLQKLQAEKCEKRRAAQAEADAEWARLGA